MKRNQIIADAEVTALYFRQLIAEGVPSMAAMSLTSSYVSGLIIARAHEEKPREPWEGDNA